MDAPVYENAVTKTNVLTLDDFWEFLERPENNDKTFELFDGQIVMMAGPGANHQRISGYIYGEMRNFLKGKKCEVFFELYVHLFKKKLDKCRNIFQPDVIMVCDKDKLTDKGCEGAPDFVVEVISKSTSKVDYLIKLMKYMEFGVKEYWIVDSFANRIIVYLNAEKNAFSVYNYTFDDTVSVKTLDGFSIDFTEIKKLITD